MHTTLPFLPQSDTLHAYRLRWALSADEWNDYYQAAPYPHLTQAYAYGEAKHMSGSWHAQRIVIEQGKTPVAICQLLELRVAGLRVATRINRGPIFLDEAPSYAAREAVMGQLRQHFRIGRGGALLIAPALDDSDENRALMKRLGFWERKKNGWCSALIDLRLSEDEIRKRLTSVWRNRLKAALNCGLEVRIANDRRTFDWMLDRHKENMRAKGFVGPKPALLQALHRERPSDFRVLQAIHRGEAVGGLILAEFGRAAEYYVGWFGAAGRKLNCGNFLYWQAIREAKRAGHQWFDLGGYFSNDKFGQFKQNMRGSEYRLAGEWISV